MPEDKLEQELRKIIQPLVRDEVKRAIKGRQWRWAAVPEAAQLLGISEAAVRQRVRDGKLPAKTVDRRILIDLDALDRQIDALP